MATCPHCGAHLGSLSMNPITGVSLQNGTRWNCMVFSCPGYDRAIGADVDATAVRSDLIAAIQELAKKLGVG